ncbi:MAG: caspase family protein, partial [Nitrososphaeraceae archaeon]
MSYVRLHRLDFCQKDGEAMYELLIALGYEITNNHKLLGEVKWDDLRERMLDFFFNSTVEPKDTLLFYFSGHGVPDAYTGLTQQQNQ